MTSAQRIEHRVDAYLSNEDSPDISNPIHSTEVAARYGFSGALVGGVTVWGWATSTVLEALGEGWLDHGWAEFAFRQPTFPGDRLSIVAEPSDEGPEGAWSVGMINQEGVLCVRATVGLGDGPWIDEFVTPARMTAAPSPEPRPPLILDDAPVGEAWTPTSETITPESMREFATEHQHSDDPRFVGEDPAVHPAWTAGWAERLLRHNWSIPSSMHTRSRVQHLRRIDPNSTVTGGAHLLAAYERRAHHFAEFDVLLRDEGGADLARLRHTTIFRIATPEERAAAEG